ncbi:MAG: SpoVR family protein, partial [Alphaproteobacteria bacterium]|nr:SpoVR family protein [Alphaproteobacteria bacterium]
LEFAKAYIMNCEERYGQQAVERLLDAAHALMHQGVHRYPRAKVRDLKAEAAREAERHAHQESIYNVLWSTLPVEEKQEPTAADYRRQALNLPQENILYFLEKSAPQLAAWEREILRIIRLIAQYFYPQMQTKVMNEGAATYCHYRIMTRLHEKGQITDGAFMEFLQSHTNVTHQPMFDSGHYGGFNPYALGFGMMQDISRICTDPTSEDRDWFPDIAGSGDPDTVMKHIWANYRDESFIGQFLSPHLIRTWKLFKLGDQEKEQALSVDAIHNERGYREIRRTLARQYDIGWLEPDIQIVDVDMAGDRHLMLEHKVTNGIVLAAEDADQVLQHLANLWGYGVCMNEVDAENGKILKEHRAEPRMSDN